MATIYKAEKIAEKAQTQLKKDPVFLAIQAIESYLRLRFNPDILDLIDFYDYLKSTLGKYVGNLDSIVLNFTGDNKFKPIYYYGNISYHDYYFKDNRQKTYSDGTPLYWQYRMIEKMWCEGCGSQLEQLLFDATNKLICGQYKIGCDVPNKNFDNQVNQFRQMMTDIAEINFLITRTILKMRLESGYASRYFSECWNNWDESNKIQALRNKFLKSPIEKDIADFLKRFTKKKIKFIITDMLKNNNSFDEEECERIKRERIEEVKITKAITKPLENDIEEGENGIADENFKNPEEVMNIKKAIKAVQNIDEWVKANLNKNLQALYKNLTSEVPLNNTELSQELGVDPSTISKWKKELEFNLQKKFFKFQSVKFKSVKLEPKLEDIGMCKIIQHLPIAFYGAKDEEGSFREYAENRMSAVRKKKGRPMTEEVKTKICNYLIALRKPAWKESELNIISDRINISYTQLIDINNDYLKKWYEGWKKELSDINKDYLEKWYIGWMKERRAHKSKGN